MRKTGRDMDPRSLSTGEAEGSDLARTFDYWSPAFAPDPYPLFRQLRAGCPVARSDELEGYYSCRATTTSTPPCATMPPSPPR